MSHFRVRYATYNGRFEACTMLETVEFSHEPATEFPQNNGRLEKLLNHGKLPQNEDSFFLDIWTPETKETKPVLFWIHGGAFVAGSSGDKQNDAEELAKNAEIVVVSVSYRIGILGTTYLPKNGQLNCGFHDIITALEWTNKFISEFNGDRNNITIGGQSSGAWYAMAIHTSSKLQHLFKQTMLFSWPGTMKALPHKTAQEISERINKKSQNIESQQIRTILQIQKEIGHQNKKNYKFDVPLLPCIETDFISDDFFRDIANNNKRIFMQYTANECGAYIYRYPIGKHFPSWLLSFFLKQYSPEHPYKSLKNSRKETKDTYQSAVDITTKKLFHEPTQKIAQILGERCTINQFSYPTKNKRIQCCHCFDIPFIFGCFEYWKNSKIYEDCDFEQMKIESLNLQQIIKKFIHQS